MDQSISNEVPSGAKDSAKKEAVKRLPPSVVKEIANKNNCRRLAGLPLLEITVRRCIRCHCLFESAGNRTCGCSASSAGYIAGREII